MILLEIIYLFILFYFLFYLFIYLFRHTQCTYKDKENKGKMKNRTNHIGIIQYFWKQ